MNRLLLNKQFTDSVTSSRHHSGQRLKGFKGSNQSDFFSCLTELPPSNTLMAEFKNLINILKSCQVFDGAFRLLFLFKTGPWRTFRAQRPQEQLSGNFLGIFKTDHGRKQSVRLQHRAHPLPAARTQAAGDGVFTGRVSPGTPRRIQSGLRESQTPCAGPCSSADARLPAVPRDELWRGVLPVRPRVPSHRLHQHLFKLRSLCALQQPGLCRYFRFLLQRQTFISIHCKLLGTFN